jgi:uncharacterized protein
VTDEAREPVAGPRCPTCARPGSWAGNPARPSCSLTFRLIDLGHWLDGYFRVPGAPLSLPDPSALAETATDG